MLGALRDELSFGAISRREMPVASHLPYSRHVNDHVVKTRTGLFMTFMKLEGYCFETADQAEINSRLLARNDLIRTLGSSKFAVYSHIIRREVTPDIPSSFDNDFCRELDERYKASLSKKRMFVNELYLTVIRRQTLKGNVGTFDALMKSLSGKKRDDGEKVAEADAVSDLMDAATALRESMSPYQARMLGVVARDGAWHSEPLEFLVQLSNGAIPRPMPLPRMPLNEAVALKRVFFGRNALEIRGAGPADTRFGAMLSIKEYPPLTGPGFLDNLLRVPHEFIVSQSFGIVDKTEAMGHMDRVSRQIDMSDEAESVVQDHLETARNELLGSEALYGEHHFSVMALGETLEEVNKATTAIGAALTDRSVLWVREDLDLEPAFWAQMPGNFEYIARKGIISSKNFAGFASLHNFPSGQPMENHWGPAISVFETSSQTAYYFNFHLRDLGNFTVVGPSGSGKTVFLGFVAAQSQRVEPRPKLVFIDKDRGAEIFIRALGGQYEVLRPGEPTGFNPLHLPDTPANQEFLFQLFSHMLARPDRKPLAATEEQVIRNAISHVMQVEKAHRTLEGFGELLQGRMRANDDDLASRLVSWTRLEQRGWLFNNPDDKFAVSSLFGFDMTAVLDDPAIRTAALMYIFHRTDELLTGDPVMIFLDEGWRLLDDEVFAYFIKDKLKTIRKQNGIIGFGTQSAADIVNSKSANTLIEQTATNIFFPNPKADDASYQGAFRLSNREVKWIRESTPERRSFIIKHGQDSVIARLNLAAMPDLIKVLSGRTETVAEVEALRGKLGDDPNLWLPVFLGRR
jgi:type IV secretion system protein VirB4